MAPKCLDARKSSFRFFVLSFNWLVFGGYFCMDMPSVLQTQFESDNNCNSSSNSTCCKECLGMSGNDYNLLYGVYAWTNAIIIIGAGFLIDKLGNRVGAILFSSLTVLGSALFAGAATIKSTKTLLPLMLLGRILMGGGNGSLLILQNRMTAYWFKDKELALALGISLALNRLGSVLNFLFTESLEEHYNLEWCLWFGTVLCVWSFVCAIITSCLDFVGKKQLNLNFAEAEESKSVKITDIRHFTLQFWLLCFTIMFFYNGLFPFISDGSTFIQEKFDYKKKQASYITGSIYDVSLILSPFLGGIVDVFGKRGYLSFACALFTLPVFGLLAFSEVYPLISTIWLGITYSLATACMLASLPLVAVQATLGTALGVAACMQMMGTAISTAIIGAILGKNESLTPDQKLKRWKYVIIYFFVNIMACAVTSAMLTIVDMRRDGVLNLSRKQKKELLVNFDNDVVNSSSIEDEPSEKDPLISRRTNSINQYT